MFGCNGKWNFLEIHFLLTNIYSFDPEIILHSYFQFKSFPEKEREREREREERAQIGEREREEEERAGDRRGAWSSDEREERAGNRRAARSSDERARRSCRSSDDRTDLAFTTRSHLLFHCAILIWLDLMNFFCWVLFLLWMSVELIHYLHVYHWGSVWKIGHVKHFL